MIFFRVLLVAVFSIGLIGNAVADLNDSSLVAYYPFNGGAEDASDYGNDGIENGGVGYTTGIKEQAVIFDGIDDYIYISHDSSLNVAGDFSISFWINSATDSGTQDVIVKGRDCLNHYMFSSRGQSFNVGNGNSWCDGISAHAPFPINEWHHVTGIIDNTNGKIKYFLDGVLESEKSISTYTTTNNYPLIIGRHFTNSDGSGGFKYQFKGMIDELRIYNRALSETETQELYNDGSTTTNTPPVANAGPDQAVIYVGSTIQLDGSQSYDADGDSITYKWILVSKPEGSTAEISDLLSPSPTFVADIHGNYSIVLVVSDESGSRNIDQVIVSFENVEPIANATPNQSVVQGEIACFDGTSSYDDNMDILSFKWSITSRPSGSLAYIDDSSSHSPCMTTDLAGNYELTLIVNDGFVDSKPSIVSVLATTYLDATTETLQEAITEINSIALSDFKVKAVKKVFTKGVNKALEDIDKGNYADALDKLQNNILGKTDGCATSGSPDKNDWIQDCTGQDQVYSLIMDVIGYISEFEIMTDDDLEAYNPVLISGSHEVSLKEGPNYFKFVVEPGYDYSFIINTHSYHHRMESKAAPYTDIMLVRSHAFPEYDIENNNSDAKSAILVFNTDITNNVFKDKYYNYVTVTTDSYVNIANIRLIKKSNKIFGLPFNSEHTYYNSFEHREKINGEDNKPTINGHDGIDVTGWTSEGFNPDANVVAVADGKIIRIDDSLTGIGRVIWVYHKTSETSGYTSLYAHLNENEDVNFRNGDEVNRGTVLGKVRTSGLYKNHLHLEIFDSYNTVWYAGYSSNKGQIDPLRVIFEK